MGKTVLRVFTYEGYDDKFYPYKFLINENNVDTLLKDLIFNRAKIVFEAYKFLAEIMEDIFREYNESYIIDMKNESYITISLSDILKAMRDYTNNGEVLDIMVSEFDFSYNLYKKFQLSPISYMDWFVTNMNYNTIVTRNLNGYKVIDIEFPVEEQFKFIKEFYPNTVYNPDHVLINRIDNVYTELENKYRDLKIQFPKCIYNLFQNYDYNIANTINDIIKNKVENS